MAGGKVGVDLQRRAWGLVFKNVDMYIYISVYIYICIYIYTHIRISYSTT